jgi:hypothetical protein
MKPSPPKIVYIDIYIDSIDPVKCRAVPSPKNIPPLLEGPNGIVFQNEGHNGFDIYFELQDKTFGYYFPDNSKKHDALWSQTGSECPKKEVWDVLNPIKIFDPPYPTPPSHRTLMWAKNPNPGPSPGQGPFQYNLRVTNGTDWKDLDPGGDNMNGPISRNFDWSAVLVGAGSALVTTLVIATGLYLAGFELVARL